MTKRFRALSFFLILLSGTVLLGFGCKAKSPEAPMTGESGAGSLLTEPNDFHSNLWIKKDTDVVRGAVPAPDGKSKADMLRFKKKDATVFQADNTPVKPGDTVTGSIWLWAKEPVIIKIGVIRHCEDGNYEGTFKDFKVSDKPAEYKASHTFTMPHGCARLQLYSHKEQEVYAWGAKLY
jgi:plastocyanin